MCDDCHVYSEPTIHEASHAFQRLNQDLEKALNTDTRSFLPACLLPLCRHASSGISSLAASMLLGFLRAPQQGHGEAYEGRAWAQVQSPIRESSNLIWSHVRACSRYETLHPSQAVGSETHAIGCSLPGQGCRTSGTTRRRSRGASNILPSWIGLPRGSLANSSPTSTGNTRGTGTLALLPRRLACFF